jgi:hypothetical protein
LNEKAKAASGVFASGLADGADQAKDSKALDNASSPMVPAM